MSETGLRPWEWDQLTLGQTAGLVAQLEKSYTEAQRARAESQRQAEG